jgi:signal transduction histidine kinase
LNKVKSNAKHLLSLINDILDISKIEADKIELNPEEFDLKDIVNEVIEIMNPKVMEKQLEMTTEIPDNLIIYTDTRRIKQVLLNLVSNAVNYTETGNIHIYAKKLSDNKFKLSVTDTGIGISEKEITRLFQPFQQIDSSLAKKNKGTGLGLYLCKKIMTLLKGDINVESEPGKGSKFYIEMPVKLNS